MNFSWKILIDAGIISGALLLATFMRAKIGFLQRYLVPNALTAGFLLLPVYNYLLPVLGYGSPRLGDLVYHLLSLSFIALGLRKKHKGPKDKSRPVWAMATVILSQYVIQAILGLFLALLLVKTVMPQLNLAFGLHLPLGFALGPGQAYAIGAGWESMGFEGAASLGLTMAALGYLWASIGGIALVNYGVRKGHLKIDTGKSRASSRGIIPKDSEKPVGSRNTIELEAMDSMSFHTAFVALCYILSYALLLGISWALSFLGDAGNNLANNLWGINFIFAALVAMLARKIIDSLKIGHLIDDDSMSRISGISVDYMVASAIAAISLVFIGKFWLPILVVSTAGGIVTTITVPWLSSRIFRDASYERMIMIYGMSTGTLSSGLALLRIVDPEFKTRVSNDYMLSAGIIFALAIPFILSINLPVNAGVSLAPFWLFMLVSLAYLIFIIVSFSLIAKKRAFKSPGKIWLVD